MPVGQHRKISFIYVKKLLVQPLCLLFTIFAFRQLIVNNVKMRAQPVFAYDFKGVRQPVVGAEGQNYGASVKSRISELFYRHLAGIYRRKAGR